MFIFLVGFLWGVFLKLKKKKDFDFKKLKMKIKSYGGDEKLAMSQSQESKESHCGFL